ncbi:MAG: ARPP-1 family domain-containing protein [Acidimicrobiia bacterium]
MPTLTEIPELAKLLATILPAEPVSHGALTAIPLLAPNLEDPNWLTLDDLIPPSPQGGEGRVRGEPGAYITEATEAGTVPFIQVTNATAHPLLLLDGEELLGAKQNRILNTTVLVAAHAELTIPASCVEQGRWGYRGRRFTPGDASLFASALRGEGGTRSEAARAPVTELSECGVPFMKVANRGRWSATAMPRRPPAGCGSAE